MPDAPAAPKRSLVEAIVASTIGTTIEWYDFFLYGTAAALVFPALFFPKYDAFTGQILSFSTFTIGFLARPIGGVVFGYLGDRIGRKSTLVMTLLLMGISTLLIGFLPTYAEVGIAAPILLTLLRFLQGLGVGGEWGGAVLMAVEHGHKGRRGFYASWPQAGVPLGLLASTGVMALCQASLSPEDFHSWGWRVPFYLSGALVVVGLLIRIRIMESPLFTALQNDNQLADAPIRETLRRHWREILLAAGVRLTENSCFYLFAIATIWTRRRTYMAGCWFMIFFAWPFYAMLETRQTEWIILATVLGLAGGHAVLYSIQAAMIPELFGTRVRCTGASIGYQLGSPIAGGLAPLIATVLIREFPGQYWPLAVYIILISFISLACVHRLAETSHLDLDDSSRSP
ncbi:MAG: MHS family MFS transporter [Planctomycetes bacterium]|nr:MHS family MFS transporter [Planctomycetota bacterium]